MKTKGHEYSKPAMRNALVAFSTFILAFYWLVVATYPEFFIFNPFADTWVIRQWALLLSLIGWLAISTLPAAIFYAYAAGWSKGLNYLPFIAAIWPLSVILNQVLAYVSTGNWYFNYLVDYPVFIATDILLPVLLIALWWDLRIFPSKESKITTAEQTSEPSQG